MKDILHHNYLTAPIVQTYHHIEQTSRKHQFLSLRAAEFITDESVLEFSMEFRQELFALVKETLHRPSFEMVTIHDEFKCHPNHMNDMRFVYMMILAELADSRVGECIIQEVRRDDSYRLQKLSTDLGDSIIESEYFLS